MEKEVTKTVVQIEHLEAIDLVGRLDNLESILQNFIQSNQSVKVPQQQDDYITRNEIAKLFKITLVTVSDWTKKGILQSYKIGNRVLYKKHEVESRLIKISAGNGL